MCRLTIFRWQNKFILAVVIKAFSEKQDYLRPWQDRPMWLHDNMHFAARGGERAQQAFPSSSVSHSGSTDSSVSLLMGHLNFQFVFSAVWGQNGEQSRHNPCSHEQRAQCRIHSVFHRHHHPPSSFTPFSTCVLLLFFVLFTSCPSLFPGPMLIERPFTGWTLHHTTHMKLSHVTVFNPLSWPWPPVHTTHPLSSYHPRRGPCHCQHLLQLTVLEHSQYVTWF